MNFIKGYWRELLVAMFLIVSIGVLMHTLIYVLFDKPQCFNHTIWVGDEP